MLGRRWRPGAKPLFVRGVAVTAVSPALSGWHLAAEGMGCLLQSAASSLAFHWMPDQFCRSFTENFSARFPDNENRGNLTILEGGVDVLRTSRRGGGNNLIR